MTKILKRPLSVLLAALMIVSLFAIVPITASAATTGSFGSLTWNIDDDGTLTFSGSGAIPMEAFEKNGDVKKVIINDSVTELGAYAFLGCPNLTEVDIQNPSVSLKGAQHFATAGVTTVTLPEGMTTIPYGMFRRCGALTTVDLPSTITRIEDLAFEGSGLQSISVPEGATYESNSFQTDSLQSLTLEGSSPMTFTGGEFTFLSDAATVFIPEGSTYVYSTTTLYVKDPSNWDAQEMLEYAQEDFNERIEFGSSPEEALAEVNDLYGDYYGITEPFTVTLNEGDKCEAVFGGATIGKYAPAPTTYTVTWKNGDGTVIDTTEVEEGTVPTHADATKANDTFYSYTFAGWNDGENTYAPSELPAVTGDVTYTATFTSAVISERAADLVEITDHETELADLGLDDDMSEWGRSMTAQEAITLAQYLSAQNDGANCAVLYEVVENYELEYAMSDGTTGSHTSFYYSSLNDFLPDYKVYYLPVNLNPETIELNLNQDNATVNWDDSTGEYGYWAIDAIYDGKRLTLNGENQEQAAGTYEWADMKEAGTPGITDAETYERIVRFINGSCTVTVDEDVVTVSGTFTGVDRNTYVVTVTHEAPYYTITDESVNGAVTAVVNGADVTRAKAGKTVLLNVAPADGYRFKSITASAPKDEAENFSDLVALMGDAVFDGDEDYDCGGYTCKVEDGKFVVYNGTTLVTELSKSNMTGFNGDNDYCVKVNSDNVVWNFYVENGEITGIDVMDADSEYDAIFSAVSGSKSTGTLPLAELALTTVTEGSQYSFTMPKNPVTVTAEFEAIPTYTVTWKNGDTVLETDTDVEEGTTPTYDGATPEKAEDENYTYTFAGWTDGTNTYGATDTLPAVAGDITYTATFTATAKPKDLFPQHSITLGGDIGVNFYIDSAAADFANAETAVVKFTWDNGNYHEEVDLKALTPDTSTGYYKATVDVVAAHMAHEIHAEVYLDGEKLDQTDDYSVKEYAETVYANPEAYDTKGKPDELKALVKALLNYGAMAQTVFATSLKEHPALANTVVGDNGYAAVTAEQIGDAVKGTSADLNKVAEKLGAEYYTSSLIYLSKNTLRVYFTPTTYPGTIPNADKYAGNLSDYYYYVDHANIPAAELDEQKELTVGDYTFTYTALDYAKAVVNSGMGDDQKNLAKALYLYNQKANAYFDDAPAPVENVVDLGTLQGDYEAQNNDVLTGVLSGDKKISIADGATITLRDANITLSSSAQYAGITPLGDAKIVLDGTNTVKGGYEDYPGVFVPVGKTLTIDGTGSLNASSNGYGCGIGGGFNIAAGNIVINGGTIIATGGELAAGIGSGRKSSCGNITITGGTVTATGGKYAAGIGSGAVAGASCGNITIANTVTSVTATKGGSAPNSIGAGYSGTCGTVTIADGANVTQN